MVIKCAFGRPKARFLALRREMDIMITDLPSMMYACFLLHNYCQLNDESLLNERIQGAIHNERESQPTLMHGKNQENEGTSKEIRIVFVQYFD